VIKTHLIFDVIFQSNCLMAYGTNGRKVSHLIWLAIAWCILLEQNNILLNSSVVNIMEVVV